VWRWIVLLSSGCDIVLGTPRLGPCTNDDGDQLCDVDDPCPGDPGDGKDADGDHVGDDCDPHALQPIDRLLLFEPFTSFEPTSWSDIGLTPWTRGVSSFDQLDPSTTAQVERTVSMNVQPTVEVSIDATLDAELSSVGVYVENKSHVPLECRVVHLATGDELRMVLGQSDDNATLTGVVAQAGPLAGVGLLRISGGQLDDGSVRCSARYGNAQSLPIQALQGLVDPRDNFDVIGFHTIHAAMSVDSFTVFTLVP
jgi:hypothetical protein